MRTWIAVTDSAHARIFRMRRTKPWSLIEELQHPESRMRNADVVSDGHGTHHNSLGDGVRGAMESIEPKEVEKRNFARELAEYLEKHALEEDYDRLVLVAPPHFLGLMRKSMSSHAEQRLQKTINKDLTAVRDHELPTTLGPQLFELPSKPARTS